MADRAGPRRSTTRSSIAGAASAASRDPHLTLRRVERQQRLVELLAGAGERRTASSLARDLGVATRTVERDLERLRQALVPIDTKTGPGGGVRLDVRPGLRQVDLTVAEIAALLASLASLGPTATESSWSATNALADALGAR